jgi:hypothetical protein
MKSRLKGLLRKGNIIPQSDTSSLKTFMSSLTETHHFIAPSPYYQERSSMPLHCILLVGFHHKQGSVVEFKYPQEAEVSDLVTALALPDCMHQTSADFTYFLLEVEGTLKYGVSCFRQVPNLRKDEEMNRNYIQKSIVVLSNEPLFGYIASRLQAITQVYFEQDNFSNTEILRAMYEDLSSALTHCSPADLHEGFSLKALVMLLKDKLLVVWKLLLLEGRVLVYSKKASEVSSTVLALLSMFPGQLHFSTSILRSTLDSERAMGLPLQLFSENCPLCPTFVLQLMSILEKKGYLVGSTNLMIVKHPVTTPHVLINLETQRVEINLPTDLAKATKLTSKERNMMKSITKAVTHSLAQEDGAEWEGSDDFIRQALHVYLRDLLCTVALFKTKAEGVEVPVGIALTQEYFTDIDRRLATGETLRPRKRGGNKYEDAQLSAEEYSRCKLFFKGFNKRFLCLWGKTTNFQVWLRQHHYSIVFRHPDRSRLDQFEDI